MPIYRDNTIRNSGEAGFSLLEILVVLAIMSVMMILVGSRMTSALDSARFISTAENAISDIQVLRMRAMLTQHEQILITQDSGAPSYKSWKDIRVLPFDVPEDWLVEGDTIKISEHGICTGGKVVFTSSEGRKISFNLTPPSCLGERIT